MCGPLRTLIGPWPCFALCKTWPWSLCGPSRTCVDPPAEGGPSILGPYLDLHVGPKCGPIYRDQNLDLCIGSKLWSY